VDASSCAHSRIDDRYSESCGSSDARLEVALSTRKAPCLLVQFLRYGRTFVQEPTEHVERSGAYRTGTQPSKIHMLPPPPVEDAAGRKSTNGKTDKPCTAIWRRCPGCALPPVTRSFKLHLPQSFSVTFGLKSELQRRTARPRGIRGRAHKQS
jgi:hypothetical protein